MKTLIFAALCAIVLSSCDPLVAYEYHVENNSASAITVEIAGYVENDPAVFIIEPGFSEQVLYNEEIGRGRKSGSPGVSLNYFLIYNNIDTSNKDFTDDANWLINSEKTESPSYWLHEFIFEVSDLDF